jgi:hypothetical protein
MDQHSAKAAQRGRAQRARASYPDLSPGHRLPGHDFALKLSIDGQDHALGEPSRCPGLDGLVRSYLVTPADGSGPWTCSQWDVGYAPVAPGYRGLSCDCPAGARGGSCSHLRALVAFGLLKPLSPADLWGPEADVRVDLARVGQGGAA